MPGLYLSSRNRGDALIQDTESDIIYQCAQLFNLLTRPWNKDKALSFHSSQGALVTPFCKNLQWSKNPYRIVLKGDIVAIPDHKRYQKQRGAKTTRIWPILYITLEAKGPANQQIDQDQRKPFAREPGLQYLLDLTPPLHHFSQLFRIAHKKAGARLSPRLSSGTKLC